MSLQTEKLFTCECCCTVFHCDTEGVTEVDCPHCDSPVSIIEDCEHANTGYFFCGTCNGSGEGMHEGTVCMSCGGSGESDTKYCLDCSTELDE